MDIQELQEVCRQVRRDIIIMTNKAGAGHPGGSLSATEALVALYFDVMKGIDPKDDKNPNRDRFVLSKGHAAPALYGTLCERGYFGREEFDHFRQLHGILQGHPDVKKCPGVDASTGSLGQGISIAVGMALGAKKTGNPCHVYTIIGDGESQEGLVWEASMAAAHYHLDNLTVIFDHNGLQIDGSNDEVMSLGDIQAKFKAVGYDVIDVADGNDMQQVLDALEWGARAVPSENGGFLQVSGLTYEIHTGIASSAEKDENGMFTRVSGEYRVKNVMVGGQPLELDKTYTLASHNYMLLNHGDGYTMFDGCEVLGEDMMIDNQVLITYITTTLGGVVGEQYANPYGDGRIVAVE